MKYYAWSEIKDARGGTTKIGSEVTPDSLGIDEENFRELFEVGAIRKEKYPTDMRQDESIRNYQQRRLREMREEIEKPSFMQRLTGGLGIGDDEEEHDDINESTPAREVSLTERLLGS